MSDNYEKIHDLLPIEWQYLGCYYTDDCDPDDPEITEDQESTLDWIDSLKDHQLLQIAAYADQYREWDPSDGMVPNWTVIEMTMKDYAAQHVEESVGSSVPLHWIDLDAVARDLGENYNEAELDGTTFIYYLHH